MTHYVMQLPPRDPVRDELSRLFAERAYDVADAITGRVNEALRTMFERRQVTQDTTIVTFTYDPTKRAIEVGGEHVWEGSMVRVSEYGWLWSERWL